jgi:molybdopterin converting factor small subunit
MSFNVVFTGPIKLAAGERTTTSEAGSVEALIEEMSQKYGDLFRTEVKKTKILVNGYMIHFHGGIKTRLKSGDTVDFLQNWRILDD